MFVQKLGPRLGIEDNFDFTSGKKDVPENDRPWTPTKITDIFRNKSNIEKVLTVLNDKKITKKIFMIRGPVGSGKTEFVKLCLPKDFNLTIYDQEINDISNLIMLATSSGIDNFFEDCKKRAILIKHFDELKSTHQQELLTFLSGVKKCNPIFFTSTDLSITATREIPKYVYDIVLEEPSKSNFIELGRKITKHLNFNGISDYTIEKVATMCKSDIKQFEENMLFLCRTSGTGTSGASTQDASNTQKKNIFVKNDLKDIVYSIQEKLEIISNKNIIFNKRIIETSTHTNSVVHENFINLFDNSKTNDTNQTEYENLIFSSKKIASVKKLASSRKLDVISEIYDSIAQSSILSSYIQENQLWDHSELVDECNIIGSIDPLTKVRCYNKEVSLESNKFKNKITVVDELKYASNMQYNTGSFEKLDEIEFVIKHIIKDKDNKELTKYIDSLEISESKLNAILRNLNRFDDQPWSSKIPKRTIEYIRKIYKSRIKDE